MQTPKTDQAPSRKAPSIRERTLPAQSGPLFLVVGLALLCLAAWCASVGVRSVAAAGDYPAYRPAVPGGWFLLGSVAAGVLGLLCLKGQTFVGPNQAVVGTMFGPYVGTLSVSGWWWVNPFVSTRRVSLMTRVHENTPIKCNDLNGNPIEIGAVATWSVEHAAQASLAVEDFVGYFQRQVEAALRSVAAEHPYDTFEAPVTAASEAGRTKAVTPPATAPRLPVPLRGHGEEIQSILVRRLNDACATAGMAVHGFQISHLAYAPEIASVMLKVQQATALSTARRTIVFNALSTVRDALQTLKKGDAEHPAITFDPVHEAAFVSNLLVTMVSEKEASPVLNLNGLYG